jgi:hypothetical protein
LFVENRESGPLRLLGDTASSLNLSRELNAASRSSETGTVLFSQIYAGFHGPRMISDGTISNQKARANEEITEVSDSQIAPKSTTSWLLIV